MGRGVGLAASAGCGEEEHGGVGGSRRVDGWDFAQRFRGGLNTRRVLWWAVAACVVAVAVAPRKQPTIEVGNALGGTQGLRNCGGVFVLGFC